MVKKKLLMTIRVFGKYSMQSKYYTQHFLRWFLKKNMCQAGRQFEHSFQVEMTIKFG